MEGSTKDNVGNVFETGVAASMYTTLYTNALSVQEGSKPAELLELTGNLMENAVSTKKTHPDFPKIFNFLSGK